MTDIDLITKVAAKFATLAKIAHFDNTVVKSRFEQAGGQCECTRSDCNPPHEERCPQKFNWEDRGTADNYEAWQAHHWVPQSIGGEDHVTNCRILCVSCHKETESFGKSLS